MKKTAAVMALALGVLVLAGCGGSPTSETQGNVLKVGTNATFVPFEFVGEDQRLTGFDVELVQALADEMGMQVESHNIAFDGLIPALGTGQIDLAASGMTITPERAAKIEFSSPYYRSGLGVIVPQDADVQSIADLRQRKVAVQMGTTGAQKAAEIDGVVLRTFDHNSDALLELTKGGVDAVVSDLPVLQYFMATTKNASVKLIPIDTEKPEYFGLGIKKGNVELKEKVDRALETLKQNGKLDELYQKYFHENAPEMPK